MQMKRLLLIAVFLPALALAQHKVAVVGDEGSIWPAFLQEAGVPVEICSTADEALGRLKRGDGAIIVARGYPLRKTDFTLWKSFRNKGIRLFVEYPSVLPDGSSPEVYTADLERGVVTDKRIGLPLLSIVGMGGCHIVRTDAKNPLMVLAKVAGYDNAVFGLEGTDSMPLLFLQGGSLVAATSFSNCFTGRYGPSDSWKKILEYVLAYVSGRKSFEIKTFLSDPRPSASRNDVVTAHSRKDAVVRAADWFWNARLLIHPSWEKALLKKYQPLGGDPNRFFGEPITGRMLLGDGCRGVMEGHASEISFDGTQKYRYFVRADVHGESAFLLSSAYAATGDEKYRDTADKLLDYLFYTSVFRDDLRSDPTSPSFGLLGWANTHPGAFFNDDNARCILGVIGAEALLGNNRWNDLVVQNILSNFRLSSDDGFIGSCLFEHDIVKNGWKWYASRPGFRNPSPHFESWMWALYLWLYGRTGYAPLLEKAKKGISIMMDLYPDWTVQNGIQQERARMILPLAWLVRVEDTPLHREWLDRVVRRFLQCQDECGAIREELGTAEFDKNKLLISSNAEYGKNEASLIAINGDPVADMLYTCNFGFFSLNEAARATGEKDYIEAAGKLADFLVRIQVRSDAHPDLDGAWFRAFDYGRWDYWASNADNGWGAWCTLCGWIETWIGATEYLVGKQTSYWDLTSSLDMATSLSSNLWMLE